MSSYDLACWMSMGHGPWCGSRCSVRVLWDEHGVPQTYFQENHPVLAGLDIDFPYLR